MPDRSPLENLQAYVEEAVEEYDVPAISVAVWENDRLHKGAAGILNLDTGVEATTDSIFQIGSITKVMTAALVMQLVDEGRVDLNAPVKRYLKDFQIADREASEKITVKQLLNHTCGIAGDFFPEEGYEEGNLIARFVDRCNFLPLVHPVGEMFSYSNAAFSIAGRLVEVVRGKPWAAAMKEHIYEPLGMTHAIADPKDVIRFRTAIGHVDGQDGDKPWRVTPQSYYSLGQAPCGIVATMRAEDLILFARGFLNEGKATDTSPWLSSESAALMQSPTIAWPAVSTCSKMSIGLGWFIDDYGDTRVISHGGATKGQFAMLQVLPEKNTAFAILTNGKYQAMEAVTRALLLELGGIDNCEPDIAAVSFNEEEAQAYAGRYEVLNTVIDIAPADNGLTETIAFKSDDAPTPRVKTLTPLGDDLFAVFNDKGAREFNVRFVRPDPDERPQLITFQHRLVPRVA